MSSEPVRHRYKLTIAYDGTLFHGWQKQEPPGLEPLRTVAGVVEQAINIATQQPVELVGASRTDAGVHARGQVAHFDAATRIPVERLAMAISSRLPPDVDVLDARIVPDRFNSIGHAASKQYRYRIHNTMRRPLDKRFSVYHCWHQLDLDRMNAAAARLVGTHDFAGFAAASHGRQTTVRTIFACHVERDERQQELHVVVQGSGFLYNMVRIIAGTMIEAGRGAITPEQIDRALAEGNRRLAGPTLPPTGLCLEWIKYPPDEVIEKMIELMPPREFEEPVNE